MWKFNINDQLYFPIQLNLMLFGTIVHRLFDGRWLENMVWTKLENMQCVHGFTIWTSNFLQSLLNRRKFVRFSVKPTKSKATAHLYNLLLHYMYYNRLGFVLQIPKCIFLDIFHIFTFATWRKMSSFCILIIAFYIFLFFFFRFFLCCSSFSSRAHSIYKV